MDQLPPIPPGFEPVAPAQSPQVATQPPSDMGIPPIPEGFEPVEDHFGSPTEQAKAGLEGVAQGVAGPLATLAETKLLGVKPEDIRERAEANPWTHGLSEAAGFAGSALTGVGEGALLAKAGSAVEGALTGAKALEDISLGAKLATGAAKAATEMGLYQAGDEASKLILQDPKQSIGSAITNVGLSGLLGGVTGGLLTGVGEGVKSIVNKPFVQDFVDRLSARSAGVNPAEMMEKEFNDAMGAFHSVNDELTGPSGLKAQALEKIMPKEFTPEITNQVQSITNKAQDAIEQMQKSNVSPRYINKFQQELNNLQEVATKPEATVSDTFDALNKFKQDLQGYSKGNYGPFSIPKYHKAYDFLNITKNLGYDVRTALEDPEVWGDVAKLQKSLNQSWVDALPAVKDVQSKFMTKVEGEYVPDPAKFATYLNQNDKITSLSIRQKMMGNFVDAMEQHSSQVDKLYKSLGIENPHPTVSLSSLKESLEKPSLGTKIADLWHDKLQHKVLGESAAGFLGAAAGEAVAGPPGALIGGWLGKTFLGPTFSSVIKPILDRTAGHDAIIQAMGMGNTILKGDGLIRNAAKAIFTGAQTLPSHLMPSKQDLQDLDEKVQELSNNVSDITNIPGKLGEAMPDHSAAIATTAGDAVNYLNTHRPQPQQLGPLGSKIPVTQAQKNEYNRTLSIAQQPLMVMHHIKQGTLLSSDMATLKAIYPEMYAKMSKEIMNEVVNNTHDEKPIPYHIKQGLSMFLGQPLDSSLTSQNIMAAQPKPDQPQQSQSQGKTRKGTSTLGKSNKMYLTPNQGAEIDRNSRE